jgi:hypothetical protein
MVRTVAKDTGVYIAVSNGVFKIRGRLYRYSRGQTFPADHPLLRVRPDSFEPLRFAGETEPSAKSGA